MTKIDRIAAIMKAYIKKDLYGKSTTTEQTQKIRNFDQYHLLNQLFFLMPSQQTRTLWCTWQCNIYTGAGLKRYQSGLCILDTASKGVC